MSNPSTPHYLRALEWVGCAFGLAGSWLLGTSTPTFGWIAFLVANVALIGFARGIRAYGLLVQQVGFVGTTIHGLIHAYWPHI